MRFFAGLVTTLVMAFSLAETTWALTCGPVDAAAPASAAAPDVIPVDDDRQDPHDRHHDDGPRCPFGPVTTAQTCVIAASLPAHAPIDLAVSSAAVRSAPATETGRELLLAAPLFRPPKS